MFVSFTEIRVRIVNSLGFRKYITCEVSLQNSNGYTRVVYTSPRQDVFEFENFLSYFEKNTPCNTTSCNSLFTIILGDINGGSSIWWTRDKTTIEGSQLESLTTVNGFHQLISQPVHRLLQISSCIYLTFTDQPNLLVNSGVHPSLQSNCHHQIIYCKLISLLNILLHLSAWFGTTIKKILKALKNSLSLLIGK